MARTAISVGGARANPVTLQGPDTYHIPSWKNMTDGKRVGVLRGIVKEYGADPRVADQAVQILRAAGVQPRDYQGQATALLQWVQNRVYYVNEPGERIQSPEFTLRRGLGDCDDLSILLASFYESIRLPWKFVLSGVDKTTRRPVRWAEEPNSKPSRNVRWTHIYVAVGWPPFNPWGYQFADPSLRGAKLGWDVVGAIERGEKVPVPEMQTPQTGSFSMASTSMGAATSSMAGLSPTLSAVMSLSPSALGDLTESQPSDIGNRINEGISQVKDELVKQLKFERIVALVVLGLVTSTITLYVRRGARKLVGMKKKTKKNGRKHRSARARRRRR